MRKRIQGIHCEKDVNAGKIALMGGFTFNRNIRALILNESSRLFWDLPSQQSR
jgi:hypothetical protein